MIVIVITFLITWLLLSTLGLIFNPGLSLREIATSNGMIMILVIFGWIPPVIVLTDITRKKKEGS
jgi:hypothetical protein